MILYLLATSWWPDMTQSCFLMWNAHMHIYGLKILKKMPSPAAILMLISFKAFLQIAQIQKHGREVKNRYDTLNQLGRPEILKSMINLGKEHKQVSNSEQNLFFFFHIHH